MEYRIKVIEKYSGEKQFIPQFRDGSFLLKNLFGVALFPILLIVIVARPSIGVFFLNYFFMNYKGIEYHKIPNESKLNCFLNDDTTTNCTTQGDALRVIEIHKNIIQDEAHKKLEEKKKNKATKTMKTTYIKI